MSTWQIIVLNVIVFVGGWLIGFRNSVTYFRKNPEKLYDDKNP